MLLFEGSGLAACCAVPAGVRGLWLAADAARPCDCGDGADGRMLGITVGGLITIEGFGLERTVAPGDAAVGGAGRAQGMSTGGRLISVTPVGYAPHGMRIDRVS